MSRKIEISNFGFQFGLSELQHIEGNGGWAHEFKSPLEDYKPEAIKKTTIQNSKMPPGAASPGQRTDKVMCNPQAMKSRLGDLTAWVASEDISSGFIVQEDEEGVGEGTEPPSRPRNGMDKKICCKPGCAKNVKRVGKTVWNSKDRHIILAIVQELHILLIVFAEDIQMSSFTRMCPIFFYFF